MSAPPLCTSFQSSPIAPDESTCTVCGQTRQFHALPPKISTSTPSPKSSPMSAAAQSLSAFGSALTPPHSATPLGTTPSAYSSGSSSTVRSGISTPGSIRAGSMQPAWIHDGLCALDSTLKHAAALPASASSSPSVTTQQLPHYQTVIERWKADAVHPQQSFKVRVDLNEPFHCPSDRYYLVFAMLPESPVPVQVNNKPFSLLQRWGWRMSHQMAAKHALQIDHEVETALNEDTGGFLEEQFVIFSAVASSRKRRIPQYVCKTERVTTVQLAQKEVTSFDDVLRLLRNAAKSSNSAVCTDSGLLLQWMTSCSGHIYVTAALHRVGIAEGQDDELHRLIVRAKLRCSSIRVAMHLYCTRLPENVQSSENIPTQISNKNVTLNNIEVRINRQMLTVSQLTDHEKLDAFLATDAERRNTAKLEAERRREQKNLRALFDLGRAIFCVAKVLHVDQVSMKRRRRQHKWRKVILDIGEELALPQTRGFQFRPRPPAAIEAQARMRVACVPSSVAIMDGQLVFVLLNGRKGRIESVVTDARVALAVFRGQREALSVVPDTPVGTLALVDSQSEQNSPLQKNRIAQMWSVHHNSHAEFRNSCLFKCPSQCELSCVEVDLFVQERVVHRQPRPRGRQEQW